MCPSLQTSHLISNVAPDGITTKQTCCPSSQQLFLAVSRPQSCPVSPQPIQRILLYRAVRYNDIYHLTNRKMSFSLYYALTFILLCQKSHSLLQYCGKQHCGPTYDVVEKLLSAHCVPLVYHLALLSRRIMSNSRESMNESHKYSIYLLEQRL